MDRTLAVVIFISAALAFGAFEARRFQRARAQRETAAGLASGPGSHSPTNSSGHGGPGELAGRPDGTRGSCRISELHLRWPIDGVPEKDWVIANYVDLDPAVGRTLDYTGAVGEQAVTYDGHTGLDIEVPSFRAVDAGTPVLASADGVVDDFYDDSYDRNLACSTDRWNFVRVRHANGFSTTYAHLKKNSVVVVKGARVAAGMPLASVGSSGCSVYPHIHLEVLDCFERPVDMMKEHLFASPPTYARSGATTLMETSIFQPAINDVKQVQDPGSDVHDVIVERPFSVGVTISHLHRGDALAIEFVTPSNTRAPFSYNTVVDRDYLRSSWWGEFRLTQPGSWLTQIRVNGKLLGESSVLARDGSL